MKRTWGSRLRRFFITDPEDRWEPGHFIIALGVFVAVWVTKERDNIFYGIGIGAFACGVHEILSSTST